MLLVLANTLLVLGWSLPLGAALYRALGSPRGGCSLAIWVLLGWVVQTLLASWIGHWVPLAPGYMAIVWTLLTGLAIWWQGPMMRTRLLVEVKWWRKASWWTILLGVMVWLAFFSLAARPSRVFDEGLYYTQFIRWLQQHGTVAGLGNLHGRLAFNSQWHLLQAAVQGPGIHTHDLNAQIWLVFSWLGVQQLHRWWQGPRRASSLFPVIWLWASPIWFNLITGPSADLPLAYLTLLLAWLTWRGADWRLLAALALWATTLKLSGALLGLFPLYAWWRSSWTRRWQAGAVLGLGGLLIVPWLLRYYMLSGYWVYPVAQTAVGQPDWQIPAEQVTGQARAIRAWARQRGGEDFMATLEQPFWQWVPRWWEDLAVEYQILLVADGVLLLLVLGWLLWLQLRRPLYRWPRVVVAWVGLGLNGCFWGLAAPDPRFGLGALWGMLGLGAASAWSLGKWPVPKWLARMVLILTVLTQAMMLRGLELGWAYPLRPASPPAVRLQEESVPGGEVYMPLDRDRCWDAPLPCTTKPVGGIRMRDTTLSQGFGPTIQ